MAARRVGPNSRIIYVIYTFHRGEEGFNGVGSMKTYIYFALGCVWFAANSSLRYENRQIVTVADSVSAHSLQPDHGASVENRIPAATTLLMTFQNKHQVRLALKITIIMKWGCPD